MSRSSPAAYRPSYKQPDKSESGHWYTQAGAPAYQQTTKAGGLRATDLRDARKLGLVPSVTTVLSVLAKPALEAWKVKQGILAALTATRLPGESDDDYIARVLADSKAQAIAAAEEGTRIHDACEAWVKGTFGHEHRRHQKHVEGAQAKLAELFPGVTDWVAEASFAHESGYGGKVDLHSPSTGIVADYKTTDEGAGSTKRFHWDQHYQLAAYQDGLRLPRNECANIFVSRTEPGVSFGHKWKVAEVEAGAQVFASALTTWKLLKGFDPAFNERQAA
jgi:hypothetical protein